MRCFLLPTAAVRGGFGGGPRHLSHSASTYAAVLALMVIGTPEAYALVDRQALYAYYMDCKDACGAFSVHRDGELDVRGTYTVVAVSDLLNILTPEMRAGVVPFLLSCQTYEGGFAGEPSNEAHGGYTFCAMAALSILGSLHLADLPALSRWLTHRQLSLEGGFSGRTNKLVDGCYSFWQGACFAMLQSEVGKGDRGKLAYPCFDTSKLQRYVLFCCQALEGGLRDKPSKSRDHYHSCYCLSGLSVAQQLAAEVRGVPPFGSNTKVGATHPLYNVRREKVDAANAHFRTMPLPTLPVAITCGVVASVPS